MTMASNTKVKLKRLTPDTLVEFMRDHVKEPMNGPKIMALLRAYGYRHTSFHNVLSKARKNGEWRIVTIPNKGFMYTENLDDAIQYNERRKSSLSVLRYYVIYMLKSLNYNKLKRRIGCE